MDAATMSEKTTWVVLTDGYFIKIMYFTGEPVCLSTYREDDFEKSSDITYQLITRFRESNDNKDRSNLLYTLLIDFLTAHLKNGDFSELIFLAPEDELIKLNDTLPDILITHIGKNIPGDYLALSQDQLESVLIEELQK
jgi:hypothetical protein